MKPSEVIKEIESVLDALAPTLDELAGLIQGGGITPAQAHLRAAAALNDHLGKIGDGKIIQAIVNNLPAIINLIGMFFGGGGFHFPTPTPTPTPAPAPTPAP